MALSGTAGAAEAGPAEKTFRIGVSDVDGTLFKFPIYPTVDPYAFRQPTVVGPSLRYLLELPDSMLALNSHGNAAGLYPRLPLIFCLMNGGFDHVITPEISAKIMCITSDDYTEQDEKGNPIRPKRAYLDFLEEHGLTFSENWGGGDDGGKLDFSKLNSILWALHLNCHLLTERLKNYNHIEILLVDDHPGIVNELNQRAAGRQFYFTDNDGRKIPLTIKAIFAGPLAGEQPMERYTNIINFYGQPASVETEPWPIQLARFSGWHDRVLSICQSGALLCLLVLEYVQFYLNTKGVTTEATFQIFQAAIVRDALAREAVSFFQQPFARMVLPPPQPTQHADEPKEEGSSPLKRVRGPR